MSDNNTEKPLAGVLNQLSKRMSIENQSSRQPLSKNRLLRTAAVVGTVVTGVAGSGVLPPNHPSSSESTNYTLKMPGQADRFRGIFDPSVAYADNVTTQGVSAPSSGGGEPPQIPIGEVDFPQTGYGINSPFKDFFYLNGDIPRQGFPISPVMNEVSVIDGKTYSVQYFERSKMENHDGKVLLELFGDEEYNNMYPKAQYPNGAPGQEADTAAVDANNPIVPFEQANEASKTVIFNQTGKTLGNSLGFLSYWVSNGGLAQFGMPISDPFPEKEEDGKTYTVQYFERVKFEYHPENQPPQNVQLSRIGAKYFGERYTKNADGSIVPKINTPPTPEVKPTPPTPETGNGEVNMNLPNNHGLDEIYGGQTFDFATNNNAAVTQMFERFYEKTGKTGAYNVKFKQMPNGDDLKQAYFSDPDHKYNGLKVQGYQINGNVNSFEYYATDRASDGTIEIQIASTTVNHKDNLKELDGVYNSSMFLNQDEATKFVGRQWLTNLLIMYAGNDFQLQNFRSTLGEDLWVYFNAAVDSHGKYSFPGNPPLEVIRK